MSDANLAKPPVGVGHMALTVADVEASHRFYTTLGLRIVGKGDDMSILELRGGTHLLLFQRGGPSMGAEADSPFDGAVPGAIDLMIEGRTFDELDAYRTALIAGGVHPDLSPTSATSATTFSRPRTRTATRSRSPPATPATCRSSAAPPSYS